MTRLLNARTCALCGAGQSERKGGLATFAHFINNLIRAGVKLKNPSSSYLHVSCANKLQKGTK